MIKKGQNVENLTEEEREAYRNSIDPDTIGTDEDKYGELGGENNATN